MDLQAAPTETVSVAQMLIDADWLTTPHDVVDFFSKPHKWQHEADTWRNCGSPDPDTDGWALFVARLDKTRRPPGQLGTERGDFDTAGQPSGLHAHG